MPTRAVIYTRVSTDEQAKHNLSLKGQEDAARKYCKEQGIEVVAHFSDIGESAKTTKRPELLKSLDYCKDNAALVDYYIVWKIDRLARNAQDHFFIDTYLTKYSITLRSVTEPITDDPTGRLMKTMLAGFAQFDNEVRGERSSSGILRRLQEGGWPHYAPLGYVNYKDSKGRPTIRPNETAPLVKEFLLTYMNGDYSARQMHSVAHQIGLTNRKGRKLSYQQCIEILKNPIYAGLVKTTMMQEPVVGLHERLISVQQHERICAKLAHRSTPYSGRINGDEWPLRGSFVRCGDCGGPVTGSSPKGRNKYYAKYHCTKCKVSEVGHTVSVDREIMHLEVETLLRNITPSDEYLASVKSDFIKRYSAERTRTQRLKNELTEELNLLESKRQKIYDLYLTDRLSLDEKTEQLDHLESKKLGIALQLNELNETSDEIELYIDAGINLLKNAAKLWRRCNMKQKQLMQHWIFPEGLTFFFGKGFGTPKLNEVYLLNTYTLDKTTKTIHLVGMPGLEPGTNRLCTPL